MIMIMGNDNHHTNNNDTNINILKVEIHIIHSFNNNVKKIYCLIVFIIIFFYKQKDII